MLDGELSEGELASLEAELLESAAARRTFRRLAWLHSDLEFVHLVQKGLSDTQVVPIDRIISRQRKRVAQAALWVAAAVILISALVFSLKNMPERPLASFRTSPGADFAITGDEARNEAPQVQELAVGSRLELRTGRVETNFASGVRVVIEAPGDLRILAENRVSLDKGRAWFEVPPNAKGFTVETSAFTVIDLGTAFGIDAAESGEHEIHVTRGVVEVRSREQDGNPAVLKEGEARQVDERGVLRRIPFDADDFPTALPATEGLVAHWDFDGVRNRLVPDLSGSGHLGRLEGGAEIIIDPERGKVLRLAGNRIRRGRVALDSVKPIPNLLAHRGLTLALWVRRDSYKAGTNPAFGPGNLVAALALGDSGDTPVATIGVNNNGGITSFLEGDGKDDQVHLLSADGLVSDENWTHLAVTFDRENNIAKFYLNGIQTGQDFDISLVGDGELDWLGANLGTFAAPGHPNFDFLGRIDEPRIYDRPLLAAEIAELAK